MALGSSRPKTALIILATAALICLFVVHLKDHTETPSSTTTVNVKRETPAPDQLKSNAINSAPDQSKSNAINPSPDQSKSNAINPVSERLENILKTKEFQEVLEQTRSAEDVIHQLTDRGDASHPLQLKNYDLERMRTPQSKAVTKGNHSVIGTRRTYRSDEKRMDS